MDLGTLITQVADNYDRNDSMDSAAQVLLRSAGTELAPLARGYTIVGRGGMGQGAYVPWIAVFDPDETETATRGLYVVYLFAADMSTVSLSLNQGVTDARKQWGSKARGRLADQSAAIRERLERSLITGLAETIDLHNTSQLPGDYEAGNLVARTYTIASMLSEQELRADLHRFIQLYQVAIEVRDGLAVSNPAVIVSPGPQPTLESQAEFKPKNSDDYIQTITGRTIRKSRKHETLVKEYGEHLIATGFDANTRVHPRDLVATRDDDEWLIEAKIVRKGNGVNAVREAIGQLLMYRKFVCPNPDGVRMLALFNEPVGEACVELLEELQIASVWQDNDHWVGSPTAHAAGLASAGAA
ncbi:MrcB family domain-containing protein [Amycolatopsis minnesotensis]|uniref:Type IV methyl-directed restriction enzyme EcoKMcrB subunit DNA-binding domain-containing protein n=1 Tax=Amycolatopsis minnesotensis TaxID=337894 RepID=A0ABN2PX32_9PSEU